MLKLLKRPQLFSQRRRDQVHAAADAQHRHLNRGQSPLPPEQAAKAIEHHNSIQASRRLQLRQAQLRELTLQQKRAVEHRNLLQVLAATLGQTRLHLRSGPEQAGQSPEGMAQQHQPRRTAMGPKPKAASTHGSLNRLQVLQSELATFPGQAGFDDLPTSRAPPRHHCRDAAPPTLANRVRPALLASHSIWAAEPPRPWLISSHRLAGAPPVGHHRSSSKGASRCSTAKWRR